MGAWWGPTCSSPSAKSRQSIIWPQVGKGLPVSWCGALYRALAGEPRWWVLPTNLNDLTKEAIAVAVDQGWMLDRGDSVCLTDAGRVLIKDR